MHALSYKAANVLIGVQALSGAKAKSTVAAAAGFCVFEVLEW